MNVLNLNDPNNFDNIKFNLDDLSDLTSTDQNSQEKQPLQLLTLIGSLIHFIQTFNDDGITLEIIIDAFQVIMPLFINTRGSSFKGTPQKTILGGLNTQKIFYKYQEKWFVNKINAEMFIKNLSYQFKKKLKKNPEETKLKIHNIKLHFNNYILNIQEKQQELQIIPILKQKKVKVKKFNQFSEITKKFDLLLQHIEDQGKIQIKKNPFKKLKNTDDPKEIIKILGVYEVMPIIKCYKFFQPLRKLKSATTEKISTGNRKTCQKIKDLRIMSIYTFIYSLYFYQCLQKNFINFFNQMANGVTTEWEDILVKKGIWNPREKVTPQSEFNQLAQDRAQEYNYARQLKEEDVDELEDELDEDFIKEFKEIRMQQMMEEARKPKFGQIIEISRDQYTQEVNEAPKGNLFKKGAFVIIHLYQSYIEKCNLINHHFAELARHYTDIKFIKILSTRCIENFPDHNLPCVIIYKDGVLHKNIPNFDRLNYTYKLTKISIIMVLMKLEIIPYEKLDSDDEEMDNIKKYTKGKIGFQQGKEDDISDDERDDRGFSNNQL